MAKETQKWVEGTSEWVYKEKIVKAKIVKEYFTLIVAQIQVSENINSDPILELNNGPFN